MGKRKKRKSNVGTIIMIIVIVLLSLFVYLLATKRIDFNNKNDGLVEDNTNIDHNKNNNDKNDKTISKEEAITKVRKEIEDYIPASYMKKYDFVNKKTALNIIHNPFIYAVFHTLNIFVKLSLK